MVKLGADIACIANALDISLLKYQERDAIIDALHKYRSSVDYDMAKAWDARCRKWYGDRFDFKRNMVRKYSRASSTFCGWFPFFYVFTILQIDWDYHMRLLTTGTPGQDLTLGSIIHFHHFRHWRSHGVGTSIIFSVLQSHVTSACRIFIRLRMSYVTQHIPTLTEACCQKLMAAQKSSKIGMLCMDILGLLLKHSINYMRSIISVL